MSSAGPLAFLLALLGGCLGAPAGPDVEIVLDTPEGTTTDDLSFELVAAREPTDAPSCADFEASSDLSFVTPDTPFVRFQPVAGRAAPALPDLGFGPVRFFARARDAACRLVLTGCSDAIVGPDGPSSITIAMVALPGTSACDVSDRCVGYVCTSEMCLGATGSRDDDGDGVSVCTADGADVEDCDDRDPARSPLLPEICNGADDDCDDALDEEVASRTYYGDADGDGWGSSTMRHEACAPPDGFVTREGDCDDSDADAFPGAPRRCSGADDDCDGTVDPSPAIVAYPDGDGDGFGREGSASVVVCGELPLGHARSSDDCDDASRDRYPGASEACDGADDDCDGSIDESVTERDYYSDTDRDGYGTGSATRACAPPSAAWATRSGDCAPADAMRNPGARERCNDVDDDCDARIDESLTHRYYYRDADGDGYGARRSDTQLCAPPAAGWITRGGDCNDSDPAFRPGARDRCCTLPDEGCGAAARPVGDGQSCSALLYPYYRWFEEAVIGVGNFDHDAYVSDTVFQGWVRALSGRASSWTCFTVMVGNVTRGRALFCVRKGRTGSTPTTPYPCSSLCDDFPSSGAESLTAVKAATCWATMSGSGAHGRRIITSGSCDRSNPQSCCAGRLLRQNEAAIILFNAFGPSETPCAP